MYKLWLELVQPGDSCRASSQSATQGSIVVAVAVLRIATKKYSHECSAVHIGCSAFARPCNKEGKVPYVIAVLNAVHTHCTNYYTRAQAIKHLNHLILTLSHTLLARKHDELGEDFDCLVHNWTDGESHN